MNAEVIRVPALPTVGLASADKQEIIDRAQHFVARIEEEGGDSLAVLALAAKLELLAKEIKQAAKEASEREMQQYGRQILTKHGVELQTRETGVKLDYSLDAVWQQLNAEALAAQAKVKEWENTLKKLPRSGLLIAHPDTGEMYHAYPPARRATETICVTIK
ncbi:hypothetical protein GCM10023189_42920 [Nibrella saemangeumensis]|uniref:Mu-like prophage host-nuclease inhibitor protein Gam n=1 Tax=Nibrella saemangeumensis TaxID=1084526 RepID=A0ABP8NCH2_9BACT